MIFVPRRPQNSALELTSSCSNQVPLGYATNPFQLHYSSPFGELRKLAHSSQVQESSTSTRESRCINNPFSRRVRHTTRSAFVTSAPTPRRFSSHSAAAVFPEVFYHYLTNFIAILVSVLPRHASPLFANLALWSEPQPAVCGPTNPAASKMDFTLVQSPSDLATISFISKSVVAYRYVQ